MSGYNIAADLVAQIQAIDRRVGALERTRTIPVNGSAPTQATADGAMQGQGGGIPRLWLRIDGSWKSTAVS